MAAPPPSKVIKALPVPEENSKKKRGGRRYVTFGASFQKFGCLNSTFLQGAQGQGIVCSDGTSEAAEPYAVWRG
jgi:hypothetical protein